MGAAPRLSRAFPDTGTTTPAGPPLRGAPFRTRPTAAHGGRTRWRGRLPRPPAGSNTLRAVQRARRRGGPLRALPRVSPSGRMPVHGLCDCPRERRGGHRRAANVPSSRTGRTGPPESPSRPRHAHPSGPAGPPGNDAGPGRRHPVRHGVPHSTVPFPPHGPTEHRRRTSRPIPAAPRPASPVHASAWAHPGARGWPGYRPSATG